MSYTSNAWLPLAQRLVLPLAGVAWVAAVVGSALALTLPQPASATSNTGTAITASTTSTTSTTITSIATGPCALPLGKGVLRVQPSVYLALADGLITRSDFAAGDVVPAGRALIAQSLMQNDNRQTDVRERIANLKLKLLNVRNQVLINQAGLPDFVARQGQPDAQAKLRITRQEEIRILERTISELEHNGQQQGAGRTAQLPYPVLLLSDPPRVAETVKAGGSLFQYAYLDRLTLVVYGNTPNDAAAPEVFLKIGKTCQRFEFLRGTAEPKSHALEWLYQARITPALHAEVARLIRSPQSNVALFGAGPASAGVTGTRGHP